VRRYPLLVGPLIAAVLLVAAEFAHLYEVRVITVTVKSVTGGSHHGYALLVIGLAAAVMAVGAVVGGARPAALALLVLAIAALVIVFAIDLPDVDETGLYGRDYERAQADPKLGFYLESAGAVLLLLSAVAIVAFGARRRDPQASG
jgi:hypothetical protein